VVGDERVAAIAPTKTQWIRSAPSAWLRPPRGPPTSRRRWPVRPWHRGRWRLGESGHPDLRRIVAVPVRGRCAPGKRPQGRDRP